ILFLAVGVDHHIAPNRDRGGDMRALAHDGHTRVELIGLLAIGNAQILAEAQPRTRTDHRPLIHDHPIELRARPDPRIVHHDTIAHHRPWRHIHPRRKHRTLDLAAHNTTITDHTTLGAGLRPKLRGRSLLAARADNPILIVQLE